MKIRTLHRNKYIYCKLCGLLLGLLLIGLTTKAGVVAGRVQSTNGEPLTGALIIAKPGMHSAVSLADGSFVIDNVSRGRYLLEISFMGYDKFQTTIEIVDSVFVLISMKLSLLTLQEVVVVDHYIEHRRREQPLNVEIVNDDYIRQHMGGSLMQSLERLSGVGTIGIGSGHSKPVIRGLGFNRIVVVENNIKHEGQQWGSDHGLEIDQFAVNRVEILKGPASLMHGSDAIGGAIRISSTDIPQPNSTGGSADIIARSNNNLYGTSGYAFARGEKMFFTIRGTYLSYADFRIPADSIDVYSYRIPLYNKRMRNTAGSEKNIHLSTGYINNGFSSRLFFSSLNSLNGFFANAHGLEPRRVDNLLHDKSHRDILFPYHEVNHTKLINVSSWQLNRINLKLTLAYQHNKRKELSQYVSHGYMPSVLPETMTFDPELERGFYKHIYSSDTKANIFLSEKTELTVGNSFQYQQNHIDGRAFIIPEFTQFELSAYAYLKNKISDATILHAGLRADYGSISVSEYFDWYMSPVGGSDNFEYVQRAGALNRSFTGFTWAFGVNHNRENLSVKANAGKSFRMPLPAELAANGVNYHQFSYEKGDSTLLPETSYQFDVGMEWKSHNFAIELSPFINYFPNYIYLNPDFRHDHLYGNGNQVFNYTQSTVFRYGGEIHGHYSLTPKIILGLLGEYVFAQQLSGSKQGFALPFSPPPTALLSIKYRLKHTPLLSNAFLGADYKIVAEQSRIVPPERTTPAYQLINLSAGGTILIGQQQIALNIQVLNFANKKYFSHTSYYRQINVPEPGRNIVVNLHIPINQKIIQHSHSH